MNTTERGIAIFEGLKGVAVLIAGFGLLTFLHKNVQMLAESLVFHMHLSPLQHYPRIFLQLTSHIGDTQIWLLAAFAFFYAVLRFFEAYGLWFNLRWAQWIAVISGCLYFPIELYEVMMHFSWVKLAIFILNFAVVVFMAYKIKFAQHA